MKVPVRTKHLSTGRRAPGLPWSGARCPRWCLNAASRVLLCAVLFSLLLAFSPPFLSPASAQDRPVLTIVITSDGGKRDGIAVSYTGDVPEAEIRKDLAGLAGLLGAKPPQNPKITRGEVFTGQERITTIEAKLSGLVNWSAGTVNLDPLIHTYRRFGFFRIVWLFSGNFPMPESGSVTHPRYRVETVANAFVLDQRVWIDQSGGPPERLEPVASRGRPTWVTVTAVAAMLLVLLASIYLILHVGRSQRRSASSREGT